MKGIISENSKISNFDLILRKEIDLILKQKIGTKAEKNEGIR